MRGSQQRRAPILQNSQIKESKGNLFCDFLLKVDFFYQDIEILFENSKPKLQTHCGAVLGLIMMALLVTQVVSKTQTMINFEDNQIQTPRQEGYFPADYVYDARDGWRIAFGLTAYDQSSDDPAFDESYGNVSAYIKTWGEVDSQGEVIPINLKKLDTEPCREEDINFNNDEKQDGYKFFAPHKEFENDAKRFYPVLQCLTNDDAELMGNYNSAAGKQLVITFEICRDKPGVCKDEDVIKLWLKRKFLLILENQELFNKDLVLDDKIIKSSRLVWHVLSPQLRTDIYNTVELTELNLNDMYDTFSENEDLMMFKVTSGALRLYDFDDNVQLAITYELSQDLTIIRRTVYNLLDLLGDIGGLAGALRAIFTIAVIIFQYKAVISYVGQHTYLIRDGDEKDRAKKPEATEMTAKGEQEVTHVLKRIPVNFFASIKLSF